MDARVRVTYNIIMFPSLPSPAKYRLQGNLLVLTGKLFWKVSLPEIEVFRLFVLESANCEAYVA